MGQRPRIPSRVPVQPLQLQGQCKQGNLTPQQLQTPNGPKKWDPFPREHLFLTLNL